MDIQSALAIAARCRHLSKLISDFEFLSRKDLFVPAFGMNEKTLAKYMTENKIWKPRMVDSLGMVTETKLGKFGFLKDDVIAYLRNGDFRQNWRIIDFIHAKVTRQDRKVLEIQDEMRIHKYLRGDPRRILSVQRRLPFRHMSDAYIEAFYMNEQVNLGFDDKVKQTKMDIAEGCREDFVHNYDPGKTDSVVALVASGLREVEECDGHAKFFAPEFHSDLATNLHTDVIREKHVDLRVLPDAPGELPEDVANWLASVEVAVAVDDCFMMKVHPGGAVRVFYERGNGRESDRKLDEQLTLLHRALNIRTEEDSRNEMRDWLERMVAGQDREVERLRVQHRLQDTRHIKELYQKPPSNEPRWGVRLSNGRWIDLPKQ